MKTYLAEIIFLHSLEIQINILYLSISPRFFKILLETIKRKSSKLASYNVISTRKAVQKDLEGDGEGGASQENQVNV